MLKKVIILVQYINLLNADKFNFLFLKLNKIKLHFVYKISQIILLMVIVDSLHFGVGDDKVDLKLNFKLKIN